MNLKRGAIALLLSVLTVGLGHLYVRRPKAAIFWFFFSPAILVALNLGASLSFWRFLATLIFALLVQVFGIAQATRTGLRQTEGAELPHSKRPVWMAAFLLGAAVMVAQGSGVAKDHLFDWGAFKNSSHSMAPTVLEGDDLLAKMNAYSKAAPKRGDVVVFLQPGHPERKYFKRVIALPGEEIRGDGREVFVNGQRLQEPYIERASESSSAIPIEDQKVPEGMVFVMGDNRDNSYDSRSFGPIPMRLILEQAEYIYWPLKGPRFGKRIE